MSEEISHVEAIENDHRSLGQQLGLFMFSSEVGAGLPLWLSKGAILRDTLERFLRQEQLQRGYLPVVTPHIGKIELYKTSGHWYKYRESMFPPMIETYSEWASVHDSCCAPGIPVNEEPSDDNVYVLKPMNCPHHIQIYKNELRSYRNLPLRLAEFGTVYRYEQHGAINGLLRTRDFTVDDAHIFVTPEQAEDEYVRVIGLALSVFKALHLGNFTARIGLRDPASSKYIGSDENWEKAHGVVMRAVERLDLSHIVAEGEAGFYGPKLDFLFSDALGRQWQLGTAQVDFNLPERFELSYIGEDGQQHRPVMIHRASVGSIERLIAILLEHYEGAFPVWLAPVQAVIIPIADRHLRYVEQVAEQLRMYDIRVEVDARNERMNAKIRDAQAQKVPCMLIVGDKEEAEQMVSVRLRTNDDLGSLSVSRFVDYIHRSIRNRDREL